MNEQQAFDTIRIQSADGAHAAICCYGAHLTSWLPAGGAEQFFLSPFAEYRSGASIRGGVPIVFPQFAELGPLPKHGLLRTAVWECCDERRLDDGRAQALFRITDDASMRTLWPHAFVAEYCVEVGGRTLKLTLTVRNAGATPLRFTAALHSYLRVDDVAQVAVDGLQGLQYIDKVAGDALTARRDQPHQALRIAGELDRIYVRAHRPITLREPGRLLEIRATGFEDAVIWNPGPALSARLKDLGAEGYRSMLCIEAAAIAVPIELAPGAEWSGVQQLSLL